MSKSKKQGRLHQKPAQGQAPRGGAVPPAPRDQMRPVEQEVPETDVLKFRISKLKEALMSAKQELVIAQQNVIAVQQSNLELQQENVLLRGRITAFEDDRDLGHLKLQKGDQLVERGGKFFLIRKGQGAPPAIPATPPAPRKLSVVGKERQVEEAPPEGDQEPEDEPQEGDGNLEGQGEGEGEETSVEPEEAPAGTEAVN